MLWDILYKVSPSYQNPYRRNSIKNFELLTTVGRFCTYLGLYKTFVKNQKNQASVFTELNELASNSRD